jgi:ArsR family transcriptional regulator
MTDPSFEPQLVQLAEVARALAHPGRLRILQILARQKTCICGDIVQQLPFSQSTVSQHLKELKRVGLITGEISGPRTCYCLDPAVVRRAGASFAELFADFGCDEILSSEGETFEL